MKGTRGALENSWAKDGVWGGGEMLDGPRDWGPGMSECGTWSQGKSSWGNPGLQLLLLLLGPAQELNSSPGPGPAVLPAPPRAPTRTSCGGRGSSLSAPAGSHPAVCGTLCRFLPGVGSVSSMSACEAGLDVTPTPFFPPYPLQPFCPNNDSPSCLPVCPASLPSSLPPLPALGGKLRLQLGQSPWWGQGQGGCGFVFIFI